MTCFAARPSAWRASAPGLTDSAFHQRATTAFTPSAAAAPARRPAAFRLVAQAAAPAPWKANAPVAPGQELTLELPTRDVQQSVELLALPRGRGKVIVVALVDPRSEAAAAGVAAGQQVLAISDPIRAGDLWELDGKSALKYVQQAIRGRGLDSLTLRLTAGPAPEYERLVAGMAGGGDADADAGSGGSDLQRQLQRLQQAAKEQDRALQEARLAKRAEAIAEGRAKLERDTDSPPVLAGPALGAGLFMLLPLTIVVAALASGYLK